MSNGITFEDRIEFLVAEFGKGRLVQTSSGRYELRGGTLTDLLEAREWASMFMPEAVVRAPVSRRGS
jgi:hypothetical protein